MIRLPHGELPTAAALFGPARDAGVTAAGVLDLCRRSMAKTKGPNNQVRQLLRALGFDWADLEGCGCGLVPCMCLDVSEVADALAKETP